MATKKSSKTQKAKPRNRVKASAVTQRPTYAELREQLRESFRQKNATAKELQDCKRQLAEALEQQTATSEILGVIASSPTDIQPVLDAIARSTGRLCNAKDAVIRLVDWNVLRSAAHQGPIPFLGPSEIPINRGSVTGRAVLEG